MLIIEILDKKPQRRGKPTNHKKQPNFDILLLFLVVFLVHFHAALPFRTNGLVSYLIKRRCELSQDLEVWGDFASGSWQWVHSRWGTHPCK